MTEGYAFPTVEQLTSPLEPDPNVLKFLGPFIAKDRIEYCRLSNVSKNRLLVNIKMTNVHLVSSKPRCFFLDGLQEKKIEFKHRAFTYDSNTSYSFHEVGFFYTTIPENFAGTAHQYKLYIKSNDLLWNFRRMKIVLEFTDQDFDEASRVASVAEPNLTTVRVGDKMTKVIL